MNWFTRLFRRDKPMPHLKDTIYLRGNRYFPFLSGKWEQLGYSRRQADQIFRAANLHCLRLNDDLSRPIDVPPPRVDPYPTADGIEVSEGDDHEP